MIGMLDANTDLSSYLWPGYTEEASNFHVLLIALISNVKHREHLATWCTLPLASKKTIVNDC
jgi:intron-binding protein aquarius